MWKDVAGFEGFYQVSDDGHVKSVDRVFINSKGICVRFSGRTIKLSKTPNGYLRCDLKCRGTSKTCFVHRMVAAAFIENPDNLYQVNHIDGDKKNNEVSNLEWCTAKHNIEHAHQNGLMKPSRGTKHWKAKLSEDDVREIVRLRNDGWTVEALAEKFSCNTCPITKILCGYGWGHVTGISPRKKSHGKGQDNARSSITNKQALMIVDLMASGKTIRQIMEIVGSSLQTTQRVCRGEAWASVTGIQYEPRRKIREVEGAVKQ